MPNLLIISNRTFFKEDIKQQIALYAPEFCVDFGDALPDIAILDEVPEMLDEIRKKYPQIPLFILIKSGDEKTEQNPLLWYVTKPFSLNLFLNKLQAAINLATVSEAGYLCFNGYELRPSHKEIFNTKWQETVKLTEKEVAIIRYLYKINNRIVSKNELLQEVWGYSPDVTTHTIETHIYRLRQKVEHNNVDAPLIITEDGGYILNK